MKSDRMKKRKMRCQPRWWIHWRWPLKRWWMTVIFLFLCYPHCHYVF